MCVYLFRGRRTTSCALIFENIVQLLLCMHNNGKCILNSNFLCAYIILFLLSLRLYFLQWMQRQRETECACVCVFYFFTIIFFALFRYLLLFTFITIYDFHFVLFYFYCFFFTWPVWLVWVLLSFLLLFHFILILLFFETGHQHGYCKSLTSCFKRFCACRVYFALKICRSKMTGES